MKNGDIWNYTTVTMLYAYWDETVTVDVTFDNDRSTQTIAETVGENTPF